MWTRRPNIRMVNTRLKEKLSIKLRQPVSMNSRKTESKRFRWVVERGGRGRGGTESSYDKYDIGVRETQNLFIRWGRKLKSK